MLYMIRIRIVSSAMIYLTLARARIAVSLESGGRVSLGHLSRHGHLTNAEQMIELYESFYLLQPLPERWGRFVNFKCNCADFFSGACCGHSTLMAMLYDSTLRFPPEWSTQQLPSRGKTSKKPSAWAELHEEEEPSRTERWAPTMLGSDDMIVTRDLKV